MTKEGILDDLFWKAGCTPESEMQHDIELAAMDQYAKQTSIAFAEWIGKEGWYLNKIQRWSNRGEKSENLIEIIANTKTTKELYQLFLTNQSINQSK